MNKDIEKNELQEIEESKNSKIKKNKRHYLNTISNILTYTNLIGIFILVSIILNMSKTIRENEKLINISNYVKSNYYDKSLSDEELEEIMIEGMINNLPDKYSHYLNIKDTKEHEDDFNGIKTGIGIVVQKSKIVKILENSPASNSGLQLDDEILSINNIKLLDINDENYEQTLAQAFNSINENEENLFVIKRDNKDFSYEIKKGTYETKLVEYKMLENNIGFLKLNVFSESMYEDFDKAIELFKKEKAKGLIIDLRYNLGGEKRAVEYIADALMKDVVIGTVTYGGDYEDEVMKTDSDALELPMVLLTNELTASSSEVLAGSIVANNRGITIGKRTYGKGTVLGGLNFKDGTSSFISIGQIVLSNGDKLEGVGVTPHIEESDESKHLDLAIDYLNKLNN